jgi:tRNA(Ile)-lysidine synthase
VIAPMPTDELLERVREGGLLAPSQAVVVCLSGGRDSVCLLDIAVELCGSEKVTALHVNYGLRGEAGDDEQLCRRLCQQLGIGLTVENASAPREGNVQAWARDVRYGLGAQLASAAGAQLAAGHTASDQVETVLYRLAASPGRRSLVGMPDQRGILIRPLLRARFTREETAEWCRARGLQWCEDASNETDKYARGRIRGQVLPALRSVHPATDENILQSAELLRDEAEVLEFVVDTALAGKSEISTEHLAALPPALARLVVRRLAEEATGSLCPQAAARIEELIELGGSGSGSAALDVGGGARAVIVKGMLAFERSPRRAARRPVEG